jgi:peptide deformylase
LEVLPGKQSVLMILPIVKYGDPILHQVCDAITVFDDELEKLSQNMVETMYAAPGYGLAAPQVGLLKRLIAIDVSVGEKKKSLIILANPELINAEGDQFEEEGCLSIPSFTARVHRPSRVIVSGQDIHGKKKIIEGEGVLSRVFAHEIDHLNGVLFIDHLGAIKRDIIKRKIRKKVRAGEW